MKPGKPRPRKYALVTKLVAGLFVMSLILSAGGFAVFAYMYNTIELPDSPKPRGDSVILADDSKTILGRIPAAEHYIDLPENEIPDLVKNAVLAAEDPEFFNHRAVSGKSTLRGIFFTAKAKIFGGNVQGGSTLTQQYAKLAFLTLDQTAERKATEAVLAFKLEKRYTKDQILAKYINIACYGRRACGIEAAAKAYYNKQAKDLTLSQAATMAAMVQQPSVFMMTANRDQLTARWNYVLDGMLKMGTVTPAQVDAARKEGITFTDSWNEPTVSNSPEPHVVRAVRLWFNKVYGEQGESLLSQGGLRIITEIDAKEQKQLRTSVDSNRPKDQKLNFGGIVQDPNTGAIKAIYGGPADSEFIYPLQARRNTGSTFKVATLTNLVTGGISLNSVVPVPKVIEGDGPPIYNFDRDEDYPPMSILDATAKSLNTTYYTLVTGKTPDPAHPGQWLPFAPNYPVSPASHARLLHALGVDDNPVPGLNPATIPESNPRVTLGDQVEVTPAGLVSMFATIANKDARHMDQYLVRSVEFGGEIRYKHEAKSNKVTFKDAQGDEVTLTPDHTRVVMQALKYVTEHGTGTPTQVPGHDVGSKTGSTLTDALTAAVTSDRAMVIWGGYREGNKPVPILSSVPAKMCGSFLNATLKGTKNKPFAKADLSKGTKIPQDVQISPSPVASISPSPSLPSNPSPSQAPASPSTTVKSPAPSIKKSGSPSPSTVASRP